MSKELTPLKALEIIKNCDTPYVGCWSDVYTKLPFECRTIEKSLKALEEIIVLHNEWLAHQKSDFEFFTLFNEIVCKYELKEILK